MPLLWWFGGFYFFFKILATPAKAAGAAAIVMGATTHGRSAAFFHQIMIDASEALSVTTKIMLMDHPHRFKKRPGPHMTSS